MFALWGKTPGSRLPEVTFMDLDLLELYGDASEWTATKVQGATTKLDTPTPCDEWNVRTLMNHMLDTQHYFVGAARGEEVSPPSPQPPELLSDDPVADFEHARAETLSTSASRESSRRPALRWVSRSPTSYSTAGTWPRRRRKMRRCPKGYPRPRTR
jgi:hypothetical protein